MRISFEIKLDFNCTFCVSGIILATGVESVDDLKEFGIKAMFAQSLFKHILKWKAEGVPADVFTGRVAATPAVEPTVFTSVGATNIGAGVKLLQGQFSSVKPLFPSRLEQPTSHTLSPTDAANAGKTQEQIERENKQTLQHEEDRLARDEKIVEISNIQAAKRALENLLKSFGTDILIFLICKPDDARPIDAKDLRFFNLHCNHNTQQIKVVLDLPAGVSMPDLDKFREMCTCSR